MDYNSQILIDSMINNPKLHMVCTCCKSTVWGQLTFTWQSCLLHAYNVKGVEVVIVSKSIVDTCQTVIAISWPVSTACPLEFENMFLPFTLYTQQTTGLYTANTTPAFMLNLRFRVHKLQHLNLLKSSRTEIKIQNSERS